MHGKRNGGHRNQGQGGGCNHHHHQEAKRRGQRDEYLRPKVCVRMAKRQRLKVYGPMVGEAAG